MKIKNWNTFQHYKSGKRNKTAVFPWIRFYRKLLDDRQWFALDGDASKLLANCWLLASDEDGSLPSIADMAFRLRLDPEVLRSQIPKLDHWIIFDASELLADCYQPPTREERRREEIERRGEGEARASRLLATGKRGTRLAADWWPSEADIQYAIAHGLSLDNVNTEAEKFRNYWTAKAGQNATKLDWDATWQNWILKAKESVNGQGRQKPTLVERADKLAEQARQMERAKGIRRPDDPFGSH